MNLEQVLEQLRNSREGQENIENWREIPEAPARCGEFPASTNPRLRSVLAEKGIVSPYIHQAEAWEAIDRKENTVIVTPTASGKTLCYNLPVLNSILADPDNRAMYLFPTKALSQDQVSELVGIIDALGEDIRCFTYDGDTPQSARKAIRSVGHIVVSNPDMLHSGILPHHTKWVKLFKNLKYIVIDEIHTYRGVFGSHLANVLRRLKRICDFYGSKPQFICCSATIANPGELTSRLIEQDVTLIDNNGAPQGKKHFIFYNPPIVNKQLGIRKDPILESSMLAKKFLQNDIQTIVFARSRLACEVLTKYLKEAVKDGKFSDKHVEGYRGGYLPKERRAIEQGLRAGEIMGVVGTNALELGIDIGHLDVCLMSGYPGTVASTWQQSGRAGRRSGVSAAVMVATSSPLDQYIITHPEYFFGQPPESGFINPNNLIILISHIKCAAFELPFVDGEKFGVETTVEILKYLEDENILHHVKGKWHWMTDDYPAEEISLRSASTDNFVIIDTTNKPRIIGEMDRSSAPEMIHKDAIYLHESRQYHVDDLNYDEQKAYVRQVKIDYYTDAETKTTIKVLDVFQNERENEVTKEYGEVMVAKKVTGYKKIKFGTHENVGFGRVHLPEEQMHTTSYWFSLPDYFEEPLVRAGANIANGLRGLTNVLEQVASLYILCDPRDIGAFFEVRSPHTDKPTVFLYDSYPGGVGLSERIFSMQKMLFEAALEVITKCACSKGCPSCVGPEHEVGKTGKFSAERILREMLGK